MKRAVVVWWFRSSDGIRPMLMALGCVALCNGLAGWFEIAILFFRLRRDRR